MTIWKFPFKFPLGRFEIEMPKDAEILSVQVQRDVPCIWAKVIPENEKNTRRFRIIGTGHPFREDKKLSYIGTFQQIDDFFVWHLFEELR